MTATSFSVRRLLPDDMKLMEAMLTTFGEAFNEIEPTARVGQAGRILSACFAAIPSSRWRP